MLSTNILEHPLQGHQIAAGKTKRKSRQK